MSVVATPLTVEQVEALPLPEGCDDWELDQGEPIAVGEVTRLHEEVRENLGDLLRRFLNEHMLGECYSSLGIRFNAYSRRRPDISFYRQERADSVAFDQVFTIAPDLAVEIVSLSESAAYLNQKIRHLRREGTKAFWLVYLLDRTATIRSGVTIHDLTEDDYLEAPDLLPGFRAQVRSLFP